MTAAADRMRNRRQRLAAPGSLLDRAVRFLAWALPMGVGVIAAMMLITPLSPRGEISFLLDRNKVAVAQDRLRVSDAMYRGEDNQGRPFSLVAGEAVQRGNNIPILALRDMTARIILPEGPAVLSAAVGSYAMDSERVTIPGVVEFTAADGYHLSARNVTIDLPGRVLLGQGGVDGVIPAGTFSAGTIRADLAMRELVLIGNARLRMIPGQLRLPSAMR